MRKIKAFREFIYLFVNMTPRNLIIEIDNLRVETNMTII